VSFGGRILIWLGPSGRINKWHCTLLLYLLSESGLNSVMFVCVCWKLKINRRRFLISSLSFRRVVNVVQFLLGNSPASVCY
jgi:hypothetical protein